MCWSLRREALIQGFLNTMRAQFPVAFLESGGPGARNRFLQPPGDLLNDIIGWDVRNWSRCLDYWQPWLDGMDRDRAKVLVLGERNGGLSLWLALQGFTVLCTDFKNPEPRAGLLHRRWKVQDKVSYAAIDAFSIQYPDDHFDVVACKSVIGGLKLEYKLASTRSLVNQKLAVEEIRRVLKPGGVILGAENLAATSVHQALRRFRHKGRIGWRYLRIHEIQWLFENYSECEQCPYGFIGTHWTRLFGLNRLFSSMDRCFSQILPPNWLYISFIRGQK